MEDFVQRKQLDVLKRKIEGELSAIRKTQDKIIRDTQRKTQEYSALKGKFGAIQKDIKLVRDGLGTLETYAKEYLGNMNERVEKIEKMRARKGTSKQSVDLDNIKTPGDVVLVAQKALKAAERAEEMLAQFMTARAKHGKIIPYEKNRRDKNATETDTFNDR